MPLSKAQIKWAIEKTPFQEHVLFPNFVRRFKLTDKDAAIELFEELLELSSVRAKRRTKLKAAFSDFRLHSEEKFWSKYALEVKTKVTALNAGVIVHDLGLQEQKLASFRLMSENDEIEESYYISDSSESEEDEERNDEANSKKGDSTCALNQNQVGACRKRKLFEQDGIQVTVQADNAATTLSLNQQDEDTEEATSTSEASDESPIIDDDEKQKLLSMVEHLKHDQCEWLIGESCVDCKFYEYQKECIEALVVNQIMKQDIADAMSIIGVFAPFLPTERMKKCFGTDLLHQIVMPVPLKILSIDFNAVMTAIQHAQNGNLLDARKSLDPVDVKLQTMIQTLPNTDCLIQKRQGRKPDRPDIAIKIGDHEVMFGEVTGPHQQSYDFKNKWDLFRLTRFGKSFLDAGNSVAPLIQAIYTRGSYMRLKARMRGMYLLEEVGKFSIPTTVTEISSLVSSLPVLLLAQTDLQKILNNKISERKRSSQYEDLIDAKKRLQGKSKTKASHTNKKP
ncbi:hypothetical protein BGZ79_003122 [Entomortierella chlamydospora]|nr:hypothetical protein BGZ79_003122 [Entomortierella chlamydospora]